MSRGEARIRRAFLFSIAAMVILASIALGLYWLLHDQPPADAVQEARIKTPVAPSARDPVAPDNAAGEGTDAASAVGPEPTVPPPVRFTDITEQAGIDFVHVNGAYGERLMPETIGSGAAFFDYDRDGDQDLFLVNSRTWDKQPSGDRQPAQPGIQPPTQRLYRNDGSGHFDDLTEAAGLALVTYGMGVAIGDYDGDGWDDLFLTTLNGNHLFHNRPATAGGRRFEDVTATAGVAGGTDTWSSSAAFLDYDRDGDLDLFVVNYVDWSREIDLEIDFRLTGLGRAYGAPLNFVGTDNQLYRNDGNGRFTDVSAVAGIRIADPVTGNPVGKGLGIAPFDMDADGWQDLIVVNDTVRNFLFRNRRDGSFEETAIFDGVAYDRNGKATSAMGVDVARIREDQDIGIAVGNFANEMASLFVTTDGRPPFVDEAVLEGLGPASRIPLTFGLLFFDYDLDGRQDLLLANGHLEHEINKVQQSQHYAQPPSLFWNCGDACRGRFVLVPTAEGAAGDLGQNLVGRGVAYADIDADGDLDLIITQNGRRPSLLRNDQRTGHHWLRVELTGKPPNTSAIGARLELTAGGVTRHREVRPTRGYLSQVERAVTFGLGTLTEVEQLRILWPDGSEQQQVPSGIDRTLHIHQSEGNSP